MVEIITGDDEIDLRQPEGALNEYYRAFNSHDLALMQKNWDSGDDVSLYHPLGGIRRGWEEIQALYEQIFGEPAGVMMTFQDFAIQRFGDTFLAVGMERGLLRTHETALEFRIRTSRIFSWRGGRWRQIHHHGSIEEPELLAHYLTLVLTGKITSAEA
jgi:ketosteroid isomerase-like protein